jgi:3-dehydroquinate synthase II
LKYRELIIKSDKISSELMKIMKDNNIEKVYIDPLKVEDKDDLKIIYESELADYKVYNNINDLEGNDNAGFKINVKSKEDEEIITKAAEKGARFIIIETSDWKIIPLENIIARLEKSNTKIYAMANNAEEVRTMFSVLELGVDGVILNSNNPLVIRDALSYISNIKIELKPVEVIEVRDLGEGERVCVDTISLLKYGEGMLIGNRSNFLFLIHNESIGSAFTSPRPFRVNAGAVHCYTLMPNGNTKYLSEIESGDEVLIINNNGDTRRVTVGRSKIETRPMRLIKAKSNSEIGGVIVQNAETIRFIRDDNTLISATEVNVGDKILANVKANIGRHFGMEVNEHIIEK